tara:strand:- start:1438 stop:1656 length:219 start_codon:yes stop_codon:yes gene_type:complete
MKVGDLVRYKEIINHATEETTDWRLGVLLSKEYNLCKILTMTGQIVQPWASQVQKAGKRDWDVTEFEKTNIG